MKEASTENIELKTIRIDSDLYSRLREYCDKKNIRFIDFVEDSLENAINFNEQSDLLEENNELLSQIKVKHDKIYESGFNKGFYLAFFTLQGKMVGLKNNTFKKTLDSTPKPVKGPQLKLF